MGSMNDSLLDALSDLTSYSALYFNFDKEFVNKIDHHVSYGRLVIFERGVYFA